MPISAVSSSPAKTFNHRLKKHGGRMPIPAFTIDGVLPPYIGADGPGGAHHDMSPYLTTSLEVVVTFGTSPGRRDILKGWLTHRASLRKLGFINGFQWLDGSFVEQKEPGDIDVMSFLYRPPRMSVLELAAVMRANPEQFHRKTVKAKYKVDHFNLDLSGSPENLVRISRYYLGLFSHRREDGVWKGMLEVGMLDEADDQAALKALGSAPLTVAAKGSNP
jgi:hypothetical protein